MIFLLSLIPAFLGILFLFLVKERAFGNKLQEKEKVKFNWAGLDRRLKIFLIFSFIFSLGNSSNQFLLLRAKNMGNPLTTVILLYLVYNLTYALASYPASRLSDKIGRKKILVAGYIFYAIVYFGFAVNNSLNTLWLLFALYGLYIGFTEGVEKALIIDISPSNLRATTIGLHATVVGIALLPASLLAGILWNVLGASAPFYFGGLMGLAASIGFWFILRGL
jgi:MFS family permease